MRGGPNFEGAWILTVRIKFCGLVRSEDICVANKLAVDFIGLVLYAKSPRALDLEQAFALRRIIASQIQCVGLFVNAHPAFVQAANRRLGLDVIQFHGDESPKRCFSSSSRPFWRAVRMQSPKSLELAVQAFNEEAERRTSLTSSRLSGYPSDSPSSYPLSRPSSYPPGCPSSYPSSDRQSEASTACEAFLVDADAKLAYGGTGHVFDWSWLAEAGIRPERLILSGGLNPENVGKAIQTMNPWAVDVSSGIQGASPRIKDAGKMEAFVNAVQTALCKRPCDEAL